jgi:polyhydroxybutyrate depolymerase
MRSALAWLAAIVLCGCGSSVVNEIAGASASATTGAGGATTGAGGATAGAGGATAGVGGAMAGAGGATTGAGGATTGAGGATTAVASGAGGATSSTAASSGSSASATASSGATTTTTGAGTGGGSACGGTLTPGDYDQTLVSNGTMRSYHVHVPPSYAPGQPTALVIVYHGFTETDATIITTTHFNTVADAHGFVVVFPQGLSDSWDAGACCPPSWYGAVDDVKFTSDLIDQLESELCIDPKRVYASGFSNGGMMSHRLACELSDRIAAIGAVAGTLAISTCMPSRPVPVLHIHGTSDPISNFNTGFPSGDEGVPATISEWVMVDGCTDAAPTNVYLMGDVSCDEYQQCAEETAVQLCTVTGGGHQWPGGAPDGIGYLTMDIDASEHIAQFFESHPMP